MEIPCRHDPWDPCPERTLWIPAAACTRRILSGAGMTESLPRHGFGRDIEIPISFMKDGVPEPPESQRSLRPAPLLALAGVPDSVFPKTGNRG